MRALYFICFFFFYVVSCMGGIAGPDVVEKEDFDSDLKTAKILALTRCINENSKIISTNSDANSAKKVDDSLNQQLLMVFLETGKTATTIISLGATKNYYTKKDRDFCFSAVSSIPCSGDYLSAMITTEELYCHSSHASLWQHQHLGQGEWSVPKGGPRF